MSSHPKGDKKNTYEDMRKEILATYYHKISTDEKPRHEFCPTSDKTWCWWQAREQAEDPEIEAALTHEPPLPDNIAKEIYPIYENLSRDDLLERCLGGYTQNSNESLNALIWKFAPKHLHSGKETVEIAAYIGASMYNEGYLAILWMMIDLGIAIGKQCYDYAVAANNGREKKKKARRARAEKKAKKAVIEQVADEESDAEGLEDIFYGAGLAD